MPKQVTLDQFFYRPRQWARVVGEHPSTTYRKIKIGIWPAKKTEHGMGILREDGLQALRDLPDVVPNRDHETA